MYKAVLRNDNRVIQYNMTTSFRLLGRYVAPKSYSTLIIQAIKNELASFYTYTATGSLKAFGYMFAGSIELMQSGQTLTNVSEMFGEFIKAVKGYVIDSLDIETADYLVETLEVIIFELIKKDKEGVDIRMV